VGAVWMAASVSLRRRWRAIVLIALLVAVVGGVVLATVAGARRTSSALDRFNEASRSPSVQVVLVTPTPAQLRRFRHVKGAVSVATADVFFVAFHDAPTLNAIAPVDGALGTSVDRPRLVTGRLANQRAVDEVVLGESLAATLHKTVGDHLDAVSYTPAQTGALAGGATNPGPPGGPQLRFRVVGIVRRPRDLGQQGGDTAPLALTRAFDRKYAGHIGTFGVGMLVRTRHGSADTAGVAKEARSIFGQSPGFGVSSLASENTGAQPSIDVLVTALWIFAGVAALAGIVAIASVLAREIARSRGVQDVFQALGASRIQRIAMCLPVALVAGAVGAALAVAVAIVASELFPIGVARRADPSLGIRLDPVVLVPGTAAIFAIVALIAVVAALRDTRARLGARAPRHPPGLPDILARAGLPPPVTTGIRMALRRGRGEEAVPLASASMGAILGVIGLTAALVFGANLRHVVDTPRLSGWTWDFKATDTVSNEASCTKDDFGVLAQRGIASLAAVCYGDANITVDGRTTNGWAFVPIRGPVTPSIIRGRPPRGHAEVALGAATLRGLSARIGDDVVAKGPYGRGRYRIVGEAVFPRLGQRQALDDGAAFTAAGFGPLFDQNNFYRYLVGRFAPGADPASVERALAAKPELADVSRPTVAVEIHRLQLVDWTPTAIAAFLGLLAIVALANALVATIRRRRRDLAVLRTLGFERRQARATVAWQATTLAVVGLVVGIPSGLIVGGLVWRMIATRLGIGASMIEPVAEVLLVIPVTLVVVNVLAWLPARRAAGIQPALALRTE
jgi:putative ABC transport system permease protein